MVPVLFALKCDTADNLALTRTNLTVYIDLLDKVHTKVMCFPNFFEELLPPRIVGTGYRPCFRSLAIIT